MTDYNSEHCKTQFESAKQKAFSLISRRSHSRKELAEKLRRTFSAETAEEVIEYLQCNGYISDEEFATARARQLAKRNKSLNEIKGDLLQKGVDRDIAYSVISALENVESGDENFENDDYSEYNNYSANENYSEHAACIKIIQKSYMRKLENGESEKVIAALMRRGFSYSVTKKAIEQVSDELHSE